MTEASPPQPPPGPPGRQTHDDILHALDQVLSLVATAERLSRNNQIVTLRNLDTRVMEICQAVSALPPSEAHAFAPQLTVLVASLDRLEGVTRDASRTLAAARGDGPPRLPAGSPDSGARLSDSTRASAAYARALAVAPPETFVEPDPQGNRRRVERRNGERRRGGDRRRSDRRDTGEDGDPDTAAPPGGASAQDPGGV
ncbi:hypothetical protein [Roseospira navarrensis]|uniref:Uncharacterized protein n=1 Tax=Roseospira navarrensis TaxID=140058 RepID=A0A7X2D357_9PROT|nr:hypothetical protein [Roseospira navarrensis]MQX35227.1 hypothetical protein [Roseospira navarrensis]